jgi:hypothetical protein
VRLHRGQPLHHRTLPDPLGGMNIRQYAIGNVPPSNHPDQQHLGTVNRHCLSKIAHRHARGRARAIVVLVPRAGALDVFGRIFRVGRIEQSGTVVPLIDVYILHGFPPLGRLTCTGSLKSSYTSKILGAFEPSRLKRRTSPSYSCFSKLSAEE